MRWYKLFIGLCEWVDKFINLVCVILLTAQTIAIIVMVLGRYLFNAVPPGTEQFSLFCLVWFAMLSISLSIRDDSHVKMEIIDRIVGEKNVIWFQIFCALVTGAFGFIMMFYSQPILRLTATIKLTGFSVPTSWLYASATVGGAALMLNCVCFIVERCVKRFGKGVEA